jgi:hypothetical protein
LNQNVAAEILDALQFAGEVNGFLPAGNRRGGFVADIADAAQFAGGRLKNFGRVAEMFQCSSSSRARTGPTCSMRLSAMNASLESMPN